MKIITTKRIRLLFFALFLLLVGVLLNYKTTYATAGRGLVLDQTVALRPNSYQPTTIVGDRWTKLLKVIPFGSNEYVAVGASHHDTQDAGYNGLIVKYTDSDNDGNFEVAWYRIYEKAYSSGRVPLTNFEDVIQLANGNIAVVARTLSAIASPSYISTVIVYDTNGNILSQLEFNYIDARGLTQLDNGEVIVVGYNGFIAKLSSDFQSYTRLANNSKDNVGVFSVGNTFIVNGSSNVYVYDYAAGSATLRYDMYGPFYDVKVSAADNTIVATTTSNKTINKYDLSDGTLIRSVDVEYAVYLVVAPNGDIYHFGGAGTRCDYGGGKKYSQKFDSNLNFLYQDDISLDENVPLATNSGPVKTGTKTLPGGGVEVTVSWYNEQDGFDYSTISYSVTNDDDGTSPDGIVFCGNTTVDTGDTFTPKKPSSDGYDFKGWYTNPERTIPYTDDSTINSDMTLYGKWERKTLYISFDWYTSSERPEGVNLPEPIPVKYGGSATLPEFPDKTGYNFELYYPTYAENVTSNKTIYVNYTKKRYPVTFIRSSKSTDNPYSYSPSSAFNNQSVAYQDKADLKYPTATGGYVFNGYYTDDNLEHLYDANTPVTAETTLYYGWVNTNLIIKDGPDGGIEVQYPVQDGSVRVDENGNVVLDGFNGNGIRVETDKDVTIVLENENNVSSSITSLQGDVTITGDGTLTSGEGIMAPKVTIDDTTVITSGSISSADLTVKDSDVTAENIVNYGGDVKIENSNVEISHNLTTYDSGDILIKDSEVTSPEISTPNGTITVQNSSVAGNQLYTQNGDVTIQDSTITEKAVGTLNGDLNIDNSKMSVSDTLIANGENNINITNGSEVKVGDDNHNGMIAGEQTSLYVENSKLDIATKGFTVKDISVKNGELNINIDNDSDEDAVVLVSEEEGMITLDGGKVNLHSTSGGFMFPTVWVKDGDFTVSSDDHASVALHTYVTQIDGGSLNISGAGDACSVATLFAMFNGGKTNINTDAEMAAVCVDLIGGIVGSDIEMVDYIVEGANERGMKINKGEYIVFNGGHTKLKGGTDAAIVWANNEIEADGSIVLADYMIMEPEDAKDGIGIDTVKVEEGYMYVRLFSNGQKVKMEGDTPMNLAKYVYIYPYIPVPNTDEVPNTVDYQILGLAGAVFIAVMSQGMIIADLYRRLHGYEEEIENIK